MGLVFRTSEDSLIRGAQIQTFMGGAFPLEHLDPPDAVVKSSLILVHACCPRRARFFLGLTKGSVLLVQGFFRRPSRLGVACERLCRPGYDTHNLRRPNTFVVSRRTRYHRAIYMRVNA